MRSTIFAAIAAFALSACAVLTPNNPHRTDDLFRNVSPGMTQAEVSKMIGAPDETMHYARTGTTDWIYRYYDDWGSYAEFSVTFKPDGQVGSKFSKRIGGGGDRGK